MRLLKQVNKYLVENHPLLWHSRSVYMTVAGIFTWLIAFVSGYGMTTLGPLQKYPYADFYMKEGFVFFHVIFCIIVFSLWAIAFYRNNAFKSHYAIAKGYFTRLFFLLFIPFLLLVSAYVPYTYGAKIKTESFFDKKMFDSEIDALNMAYPFLVASNDYGSVDNQFTISVYDLVNRVYPDPYPVKTIEPNDYEANRDRVYPELKVGDKYIDYHPVNFPENTVEIDGSKYQFYKTETVYVDKDSCKQREEIRKFYHKEELDEPEESSILNFSNLLFDQRKGERYDYDYRDREGWNDADEIYKAKYAPKIYQLVKQRNYKDIGKLLQRFIALCDKYSIKNNLDDKLLLQYLEAKSMRNLRHEIVAPDYNEYANIQNILPDIRSGKYPVTKLEVGRQFFFKYSDLEVLFGNFIQTARPVIKKDFLKAIILLTIILVWLFICFEFSSIKSFLISIPVTGTIMLMNGFLINRSNGIIYGSLFTGVGVILITMIGLYSGKMRKSFISVLINLCYYTSLFIFSSIAFAYDESTKLYEYYDKCKGLEWRTKDSVFVTDWLLLLVYPTIGILLFFPLLKKWKAYKE